MIIASTIPIVMVLVAAEGRRIGSKMSDWLPAMLLWMGVAEVVAFRGATDGLTGWIAVIAYLMFGGAILALAGFAVHAIHHHPSQTY